MTIFSCYASSCTSDLSVKTLCNKIFSFKPDFLVSSYSSISIIYFGLFSPYSIKYIILLEILFISVLTITRRFNATDFLVRLRGKRLMLVGDSMNRNQFESILCLLREGLHNKSRMYEIHGHKISKGRGYFSFKFQVIILLLIFNSCREIYFDVFLFFDNASFLRTDC